MNKGVFVVSRNIMIALFLLIGSFTLHAQTNCKLTDLKVETNTCDINGKFDVMLSFIHENTSDSFRILGNGKNYGIFAYNKLPIKLNLAADCITNYEFVVSDKVNNTCRAFMNLGKKCCDDKCQIQLDNVEVGECKNGKYQLYLGTIRTNSNAENFIIYNNGTKVGTYKKNKFPLTLQEFTASATQTFNQVVVCADGNTNCCDTLKLVNPCVCSIYHLQGQITNCDTTSATFDLTVNFDHIMTSDSFRIGGNAINYGIYAYKEAPITIRDLPIGTSLDYEFLVADKSNIFCFGVLNLGEIGDCNHECDIDDVIAKPLVCVDGNFFVEITFKSQNTSIKGFEIRENSMSYGTYKYGLDKYRVGPLSGDCNKVYKFVIVDKDNPDCTAFTTLKNDGCCDCNLRDFSVMEECIDSKLVAYRVNFKSTKTTGTFNLILNNVRIGTYSYANLPIRVTNVALASTMATFKIIDIADERCQNEFVYEFKCLQGEKCELKDLVVTSSECNADKKFFGIVKFKTNNPGKQGFYIQVNGVVIDTFKYGKEAYEVGPLDGCDTNFKFFVIDVQHAECRKDFNLVHKSCCTEKCEIAAIRFENSPCKDGKYTVDLNFRHSGTSPRFDIFINGNLVSTADYKDLPITLENLESKVKYNIVIRDRKNGDCRGELNLPIIECTTAVNDTYSSSLQLYPNPSKDLVTIIVDQKHKVVITDLLGRTCLSTQIDKEVNTINISGLSKGIYFVHLTDASENSKTAKLIVE